MLVLTPKVPSRRNIEIYYAVNARHRRQVDVARDEKLSQSRVSRICAEVKHWIALGKPGQCLSVAAQTFLAADLWHARLAYYEQQAADAFAMTCHDHRENPSEPIGKSKPPRPDARLLKQAVDCAREQFELASVLAKAQQELHDQTRFDPLYEEEMTVSRAVATCERAIELHHELSRDGVELPPLPKFNQQAIELFARNRLRREESREIEAKSYLPPEWLSVVSAVEAEPLRYEGEEIVPDATDDEPADVSTAELASTESATDTHKAQEAENVQAYGDDSAEPTASGPTSALKVASPVLARGSEAQFENQHFDYTVLARRHKPRSPHPPIRWFRMT